MSKPVVLVAERNDILRRQLLAQLLCRGFDVIEASCMSEIFRALRHRRDISLFIMSPSLDEPGDGVEFSQLICRFGYNPQVILTSDTETIEKARSEREEGTSATCVRLQSSDDILAKVSRFC